MKKGLYDIEVFLGEEKCRRIKTFRVLCKHDFSIEIPYERSKYLGGEEYTDEEIELLKEKGNEKIDNIILKAPKREESSLDEFTEYLKKNTTNLNDLEKAFLLFKWITTNIELSLSWFSLGKPYFDLNNIFKNGKTEDNGFARLFRHFGDNIYLITENIRGYNRENEDT